MNNNIDSGTALYSASDIAQLYRSAPVAKKNEIIKVATKQADKVLNDQTAFSNAYAFVGVDKATWDQTDDGDKMLLVLDKIGELKKANAIPAKTAEQYFNEWAEEQINGIARQEDFDAFKEQVKEFSNKGYFSDSELIEKANRKIEQIQNIEEIQKEEAWNAFAEGMANIGMN
jgi:hypothetical protein